MLLSASPASPLHARTSGQLISPQMLQALRTAAFGETWRESEDVDMELAEIVRKRNLEKEIASKSYIAKDIPLPDGGLLLPPPTPSELLLRYANRVNKRHCVGEPLSLHLPRAHITAPLPLAISPSSLLLLHYILLAAFAGRDQHHPKHRAHHHQALYHGGRRRMLDRYFIRVPKIRYVME